MQTDLLENVRCPKCSGSAITREHVFETKSYVGWVVRCAPCRYEWLIKVVDSKP